MTPLEIYEARLVTEYSGQVGFNIWHLRIETVTTGGPTIQELANAIDLQNGPSLKGAVVNVATYRGAGVHLVTAGAPGPEFYSTANTGPGVRPGAPLPKQVSAIISKRTLTTGARGRGRAYVPFMSEDDNTGDGQPSAAYVTILGQHGATFTGLRTATGLAGSCTFRWGVYSRQFTTFAPIEFIVARAKWATQRRRGDYGRPNTPPF